MSWPHSPAREQQEVIAVTVVSAAVVGHDDAVSAALAENLDTAVLSSTDPIPAGLDGVVVVSDVPAATVFLDIDGEAWRRLALEPVRRIVSVFQQAWVSLRDNGGRIVLVTPTIGLSGAAGLVPYTAAVEGIRAMAKSAARQWAGHGVIVNTVAVPADLLAPSLTAGIGHLTSAAVPDTGTLLDSVVTTTTFLLRPDVTHLVGQTLVVDGGSVMSP